MITRTKTEQFLFNTVCQSIHPSVYRQLAKYANVLIIFQNILILIKYRHWACIKNNFLCPRQTWENRYPTYFSTYLLKYKDIFMKLRVSQIVRQLSVLPAYLFTISKMTYLGHHEEEILEHSIT